jgi:hypothetical protein
LGVHGADLSLRIEVLVENVSIVEFAKPWRLRGITGVVDVVLRSSLADGLTTLRIEGGVIVQQSHPHVRVVIVAIERSIDSFSRKGIEGGSQDISVGCTDLLLESILIILDSKTYAITT